jgi:hypothetical protein
LTLLIDAAPLVAMADPDEPRRERILELLTGEPDALVIPAPTTAEIDYLLGDRTFGPPAVSKGIWGDSRSPELVGVSSAWCARQSQVG